MGDMGCQLPEPGGSGKLCLSAQELDRGISDALIEAAASDLRDATEGQRSADVASVCRDWAKGL